LFNDYGRCSFGLPASKIGRAKKLGAMQELLSLLACIAPVLSQATEQSMSPRLSEEAGGGLGKDPGLGTNGSNPAHWDAKRKG
jgi:hypothetical protein